jgi:hypothetical protein
MDMALRVQQHVVRFQVSMDDSLRMDVLQRTTQLGHPESHRLFRETLSRNVKPEITPVHQVDDNVATSLSETHNSPRVVELTCIPYPENYSANCTGMGGSDARASAVHE